MIKYNSTLFTSKNIKVLATFLLLTITVSTLSAEGKRYHVKSGIVEYSISGGGSILGIGTKTTGSEKLIFKNWGNIELHKDKSSTTTMGSTDSIHKITKIDNGMVYSVNFDQKVIIKHSPAVLEQSKDKDMSKMGKDMMISMGGKKIGSDEVLGYNCEIWELMGSKTWLYKGVPLKTESSIMGMSHNIVAKKAKFNISIPNSKFKLPDYPIMTMDQMMQKQMNHSSAESQNKNEQMPKNTPPPQELEQLQDMIKNLGGLFGK